jgi:hypothetical protein
MVAGGALAAGDPMMAWDGQGRLFYMGNNFNRGTENGASGLTRDNTGDIWVATYAPRNPADPSTDGSQYIRTVILAKNTFGLGSFNDKTDLAVDPVTGNIYAAWSDFHGVTGCNEILFSRSTDHGATFSAPVKISSGICGNQGPSIAIGPSGQVYIAWEANTGGALARAPGAATARDSQSRAVAGDLPEGTGRGGRGGAVMFAKWSQMPAPRSHSHARPCWPVRSDRAVHQFGAESPPPAGPRVGIGGHGPARLGAMPRSVIRRAQHGRCACSKDAKASTASCRRAPSWPTAACW